MSVTFKQVSHTYAKNTPFQYVALKNIDLAIEKGSFTAIIGHTGSGKSTLIQHINGLILPTSGVVTVNDFVVDANDLPKVLRPLRQMAGLVFQFPEYQLFEDTIEKDIIFGPKNFGIDEETAKQKAKEALAMVKMDESYLQKSPFDLSGGQKRRIAIAGILVMDPDILVLDEPTAGLDPQGAKEMMDLFKSLNEKGKTVIIVTHDMNQVLEYCDHAVVMNKGEIIKIGTVDEVFKDPEYLETLSIDLPKMTHFIHELNKKGFHIDPSIKDMDTLVKAIGGK